ncbi:hypothetical protein BWR59_14030 [Pseudomonas sp. Bc-h]|nr:hypothetical protein BWR59_14030 [Pseudomonas sp. Bc-h]
MAALHVACRSRGRDSSALEWSACCCSCSHLRQASVKAAVLLVPGDGGCASKLLAITVLSFTVWLHHFFTMGQSAGVNAAFGIATMLIGIPTGVKIYDWMLTVFRGRVRFSVPILYSAMFLMLS